MNSLEINDVLNAVKAGKGARVEFPTSTLLLTQETESPTALAVGMRYKFISSLFY